MLSYLLMLLIQIMMTFTCLAPGNDVRDLSVQMSMGNERLPQISDLLTSHV